MALFCLTEMLWMLLSVFGGCLSLLSLRPDRLGIQLERKFCSFRTMVTGGIFMQEKDSCNRFTDLVVARPCFKYSTGFSDRVTVQQ